MQHRVGGGRSRRSRSCGRRPGRRSDRARGPGPGRGHRDGPDRGDRHRRHHRQRGLPARHRVARRRGIGGADLRCVPGLRRVRRARQVLRRSDLGSRRAVARAGGRGRGRQPAARLHPLPLPCSGDHGGDGPEGDAGVIGRRDRVRGRRHVWRPTASRRVAPTVARTASSPRAMSHGSPTSDVGCSAPSSPRRTPTSGSPPPLEPAHEFRRRKWSPGRPFTAPSRRGRGLAPRTVIRTAVLGAGTWSASQRYPAGRSTRPSRRTALAVGTAHGHRLEPRCVDRPDHCTEGPTCAPTTASPTSCAPSPFSATSPPWPTGPSSPHSGAPRCSAQPRSTRTSPAGCADRARAGSLPSTRCCPAPRPGVRTARPAVPRAAPRRSSASSAGRCERCATCPSSVNARSSSTATSCRPTAGPAPRRSAPAISPSTTR